MSKYSNKILSQSNKDCLIYRSGRVGMCGFEKKAFIVSSTEKVQRKGATLYLKINVLPDFSRA